MKVLFLNPPFLRRFSRSQRSPAVTKSGTLYYPIYLAWAAGVLEEAGFEINLIDAPAEGLDKEAVLKLAKDYTPHLMVLDTSTPSIYNDVKIGASLKDALPDSFIILIGTHVSALPEETLKLNRKIDAIARGEYDYTIKELAEYLSKGKTTNLTEIKGISFWQDNQIVHNPDRPLINNIDILPFVSKTYRKFLNPRNYFFGAARYPVLQIMTARGCPHRCIFCVYPQVFYNNRYRERSPKNVITELEYIKQNFPEVKDIGFEDDTFLDKKRICQICDLIIERKLKITWYANVRPDLSLDIMKKMKKAGCRMLTVGFESASQAILDRIDKNLTIDKSQQFMDNARRAKIIVHGCFMAGDPGETKESLEENLKLAKKLNSDTMQFFPLMVYPGTKAYMWAKENGYLATENYSNWLTTEGLHNCVINLPNLSAKELVQFCDRARREYYLRPRYLIMKLWQSLLYPQEAKRNIKMALSSIKYLWRGSFQKER